MKKEADMIHPIANAPCSWGVDDPKTLTSCLATVLKEAAQAGYRSIELGPGVISPPIRPACARRWSSISCRWSPARSLTIW